MDGDTMNPTALERLLLAIEKSNLLKYFDFLGFNIVGFGCTTCIGNSGPLNKNISEAINTAFFNLELRPTEPEIWLFNKFIFSC